MGTFTLTFTLLRNWKALLTIFLLGFGAVFMVVATSVVQQQQQQQNENPAVIGGGGGKATVSPLVRRYEPLVRAAAEKYGVPQYVELLLAKMMQESGGRVPDVMQSSESIGLPMNTISDPATSIDVGVRYFSKVLKEAGGSDYKLALQSYNFGSGFIGYCKTRGGYTKDNALAFSRMMASKMGWSRYGDIDYVDHVLRYYSGGNPTATTQGGPILKGAAGVASYYLNNFRISTPFAPAGINDGVHKNGHRGIDLARKGTASIMGMDVKSLSDGVVEQVLVWNPEAGNGVRVKSGNYQFNYIHMQYPPNLKVGDKVKIGQTLGAIGSTGFSTGAHLDLKVKLNGQYTDPEKLLHDMMNAK